MHDLLQKRKEIKNHLFDSLCTTDIILYKCVIYTACSGTNHSLIPHNHVSKIVESRPLQQKFSYPKHVEILFY